MKMKPWPKMLNLILNKLLITRERNAHKFKVTYPEQFINTLRNTYCVNITLFSTTSRQT